MITPRLFVGAIGTAAMLSGCGSMMSGLDASSNFSCKAAPGVTCQSISGVHQNASAGNLPFQRQGEQYVNASEDAKSDDKKPAAYGATKADRQAKVSPRDMNAPASGMPVRQPPLVLRVWMAPYEDEAGDLHDQSYFYTMVHSGRWMIEANRNKISNQFRPIYPLNRQTQNQENPAVQEKEVQPMVQKGHYENLVEKPDLK